MHAPPYVRDALLWYRNYVMSFNSFHCLVAEWLQCFWALRRHKIPRPTPSAGAVKYTGVRKCDFERNRRLSRKRYEIGPWTLTGSHGQPIYQCRLQWLRVAMKGGKRWVNYLPDFHNYAQAVWLKSDTIWCDNTWSVSLGVTLALDRVGRGLIVRRFLSPPIYTCAHVVAYEKQQNFALRSNYRLGKNLHFRPRMLTRDLFAIAITVLHTR